MQFTIKSMQIQSKEKEPLHPCHINTQINRKPHSQTPNTGYKRLAYYAFVKIQ